jgi:hypothetical protein
MIEQEVEAFVAASLEAEPMTNLVFTALVNILKLCHASSRMYRDGADWLRIV